MAAPAADRAEGGVAVGRVFGRASAAVRSSPAPILLLALVFGGLPGLGVNYALVELDKVAGAEPGWTAVVGELALAVMLWSLAGSLTQAVLTRAVAGQARGKPAGIGECLISAVRVAPALVGVTLATTLGIALGCVLLILPGVMLMVVWAVAIPVLVEERSGIVSALRRSIALTKGVRWSIFGLLLVLLAFSLAASAAVEVGTGQWDNSDMAVVLRDPVYLVLTVVGEAVQGALSATAIAALYVELKQWKEGASVESLEQVFG